MCEPTTAESAIKRIPFKVAALAEMLKPGSYEKSIAQSVADSVRNDVEYALKQLHGDEQK